MGTKKIKKGGRNAAFLISKIIAITNNYTEMMQRKDLERYLKLTYELDHLPSPVLSDE